MQYNINYIKKNLDLKKFIRNLNTISKWNYDSEGTSIIKSAIKACANNKNKDINLKGTTAGLKTIKRVNKIMIVVDVEALKSKEHMLDYQCFFPSEYLILEKNGEKKVWKPSIKLKKNSEKFYNDLEVLEINGKLLSKISNNFKLIYNINFLGEDKDLVVDTNTLYFSKFDKKYYYVWNHQGNSINQVIKVFDKPLDRNNFSNKIFDFKKSRGLRAFTDVYPENFSEII
jgi:hypothetical protein